MNAYSNSIMSSIRISRLPQVTVLALSVITFGCGALTSGLDDSQSDHLTSTRLGLADVAQAHVNAYVANITGNTVSVIDTTNNTIVATIPVGRFPSSLALTPHGTFIYVTNDEDDTVTVVSTATNAAVATVPVGVFPFRVAITPNGAFAYVTNEQSNDISVISTATNTVVSTVPVVDSPSAIAITPDGAFAYVTIAGNHNASSVSVVSTLTNTVIATVPVGFDPFAVAVSPDGAFVYVGNIIANSVEGISVISTATNTVIATVATTGIVFGIAFSPDGAFAYIANDIGNSVSVIDTAKTKVIATISSTNALAPEGAAITPDGSFAYIANFRSDNVSVIDTATNTIATIIPGLGHPEVIAITPPNHLPTALCHNVTVGAGPLCTTSVSINNGSFDPDGDQITISQSPAGPYSLGAVSVTLITTDNFGASNLCTANVTVVDNTQPTITCAPDIVTKGNVPNSPFAKVDPGVPTATDNCFSVTVIGTRSDGQPLDAPYPFGTTTITQSAADTSGNHSACQQTITVVPNTPTDKDQCKNDGWRSFTNPTFKNQGDCVSFVAGRGEPVRG